MSSSSSPVESRKSEVLGRKSSQDQDDSSDKDQEGELVTLDYDLDTSKGEKALKIILLGDSAVGKSKLVERFLLDGYAPQQLSTYALTLYRDRTTVGARDILSDFWDTAGQERFNTMHRSYYHQAHAAILVFDATRKVTYKNLTTWHTELKARHRDIGERVTSVDTDPGPTHHGHQGVDGSRQWRGDLEVRRMTTGASRDPTLMLVVLVAQHLAGVRIDVVATDLAIAIIEDIADGNFPSKADFARRIRFDVAPNDESRRRKRCRLAGVTRRLAKLFPSEHPSIGRVNYWRGFEVIIDRPKGAAEHRHAADHVNADIRSAADHLEVVVVLFELEGPNPVHASANGLAEI